jgi:hypothetical protein
MFDIAANDIRHSLGISKVMRRMDWSRLLNSFYFTPEFIKGPLSHALENMVDIGRVVTLDEKLKYYGGVNSPCITSCPSKPDGSGHWISKVGVILDTTSLPYVTRIFQKTNCRAANETCSMTDIVKWAGTGLKRGLNGEYPMIVMDARYLCKVARASSTRESSTLHP